MKRKSFAKWWTQHLLPGLFIQSLLRRSDQNPAIKFQCHWVLWRKRQSLLQASHLLLPKHKIKMLLLMTNHSVGQDLTQTTSDWSSCLMFKEAIPIVSATALPVLWIATNLEIWATPSLTKRTSLQVIHYWLPFLNWPSYFCQKLGQNISRCTATTSRASTILMSKPSLGATEVNCYFCNLLATKGIQIIWLLCQTNWFLMQDSLVPFLWMWPMSIFVLDLVGCKKLVVFSSWWKRIPWKRSELQLCSLFCCLVFVKQIVLALV